MAGEKQPAQLMPDGTDYSVLWKPLPGPQTDLVLCPVFEVFYGGARGGGKTDGALGDFIVHAGEYGENASGLMVRRTLKQLRRTIARSKKLYRPLGAVFNETDKEWTFPDGATLVFAYLERDDDADNYQGHDYTRVYVEEIGNFPSPTPIMKLMATLRSGAGVPCGFRATGNPGGPGHQWVKARYIDPAPGGWEIITSTFENPFNGEAVTRERIYIPSRLQDNPYLGNDYIANLHLSGSPELVRAWLQGDWNVVAGAFFSEFGPQHVIRPFEIPKTWPRFRGGDWGSAKPFAFYWVAIADGTNDFPRGALIFYREWYGIKVKPDGTLEPNVGLKLTAEEVGKGLAERDLGETINNHASVLDPATFQVNGGPSIAERMYEGSNKKVMFRRADNRRLGDVGAMVGWDQVRARLKGDGERPMIYFFDTCVHMIRTLPALQHDELHPEDVDSDGEDHGPDAGRYICMSRPYLPSNQPKKQPVFPGVSIGIPAGPHAPTMNELFKDNERGSDQWR